MPKITLDKMIAGYRAAIVRAEKRAEVLTISAEQLSHFLDLVEENNATWKRIADTHARDLKAAMDSASHDWSPR